jgi:hypothetical protein
MLNVFFAVGLVFGPLAALGAYVITYKEYSRHGFSRRALIRRSLQAALVAFAFFLAAAALLGALFTRFAAEGV